MDREEEKITAGAAAISTTPVPHEQQSKTKKRKRSQEHDPLQLAYQNVNIVPRVSSGRPGSPHAFFKKSFDISFKNQEQQGPTNDKANETTDHFSTNKEESAPINESTTISSAATPQQEEREDEAALCISTQVVHQHANGLCIVTVGEEDLTKTGEAVKEVKFFITESSNNKMSAADRRKRSSKMLQGKLKNDMDGITTPTGILAQQKFSSGKTMTVRGCVWGQVMELNHRLEATPELLHKDPLLDGYLAIVLPVGPFPPPKVTQGSEKQQDEKKKKVAKQKTEESSCSEK